MLVTLKRAVLPAEWVPELAEARQTRDLDSVW